LIGWNGHSSQGRAAYNSPWTALADADRQLYGEPNPAENRRQVIWDYARMCDDMLGMHSVRTLVKPIAYGGSMTDRLSCFSFIFCFLSLLFQRWIQGKSRLPLS
jgi:hypothetical protein